MSKRLRFLVAATAVVATACSTGESAEGPTLQTVEATRGDLRISAEATGSVEPIREIEVKSKASGEVLRLHADVGDEVERGTLLAEVDPRDVRNAFEQADADLVVAEARAQISAQQLERQTELLAAGVITQQELENANLESANSQAALVRAQTNKELADLRLLDVTIRAPLQGTILQRNVEEGTVIQSASQNVSGGSILFIMASLEAMQVRTLVDETDMGQIRAGMSATVTVEAFPDQVFEGVVDKIEPLAVVQQNVTMFPVIVTLDNRRGLLKPGMNAEVDVLVDEALDVLLIPNGAIVNTQDVQPAAMALGLDPETIDMAEMRAAARRPRPQAGDSAAAPGAAPAEGAGERPDFEELRAKVESGEISQDSVRALMAGFRPEGGGRGGFARGGQAGGSGDDGGARPGQMSLAERSAPRQAVVFVMSEAGVPEPRLITIGLNDWDNTQVVSGLEGTEQLIVVGAAELQAQQQEWLDRVRERTGGSPFGGGGMGGGRGR